jgi:hypothetical protein
MWWGRWGSGRVHAGLEAAGGNRISPVSHLEPEEVAAPGQHAVGAIVEWRHWRHVAIAADQDRFRTQKVGKQILRGLLGPCHVVPCRNDFGSTYSCMERHAAPTGPRAGVLSTWARPGGPAGCP